MSDDLIKRSDAIKAVSKVDDYGDGIGFEVRSHCLVELELVPSADRPQGEWIGYEVPSECSVCGHHWDEYVFGQDIWHDGSVPNYCPHCGAKMKGADDE